MTARTVCVWDGIWVAIEAARRHAYTGAMRKLIALLLCLPLTAAAEMYRWVDAKGKVHYSQVKPTGHEYEKLAPAPPASSSGGGTAGGSLSRYAAELEKSNNATDRQRARETAEQNNRRQRCTAARGALKFQHDFEGRIFSVDEQGERKYWSAEQSAQTRSRLDAEIAENCTE